MRTLATWCPDWPVTAAGYSPDAPVAVIQANRVLAVSAAAHSAGVSVGLRRRDAESRCPGLVVLARDETQEGRAFEPVVAAIATLTPKVEVIRPGLAALDARGPARYFGGEEALCRRVEGAVRGALGSELAAGVACGVADGRFPATLAARRGVVVPPGGNPTFLAPFPLGVLVSFELVDLLGRLGIRTVGELAALDARSVLARFGTEGARAHALARGHDPAALAGAAPAQEPVAEALFDPPVDQVDRAAFAARGLAAELTERLSAQGLACARLRIETETEHGESLMRLWRGDDDLGAEAMVERVRWQLGGWLSGTTKEPAPTAGLSLLRLVADEVVPAGSRQTGFWGGTSAADRRAARALDRLRGMLGPSAVFTGALGGGRGPADRAVLVAWGESPPPTTRRPPSPGPVTTLAPPPPSSTQRPLPPR